MVTARYGLNGHPPRSLRQLGAQLGLSHERIRQADYRRALALNAALRQARRRRRGKR
ncbi:MAG: hypothetical protein GTO63_10685 [Anaerolineae bacterium]|nr:hypothetical protein [Anaerolineae bacterium]NIQ78332.1 hypothetical protein [Anaerolineae bacterium]